MQYSFNMQVSGSINQTVEMINHQITLDDLITGLQNGKFVTTIGESREIYETENWTTVAKVVVNEVLDDMEYSDFGNE